MPRYSTLAPARSVARAFSLTIPRAFPSSVQSSGDNVKDPLSLTTHSVVLASTSRSGEFDRTMPTGDAERNSISVPNSSTDLRLPFCPLVAMPTAAQGHKQEPKTLLAVDCPVPCGIATTRDRDTVREDWTRGHYRRNSSLDRHMQHVSFDVMCQLRRHLSAVHNSASCSTPEVSLKLLGGEDEGIAVLSLNRPEAKNAIGRIFLSQLLSHLQHLHAQSTTQPLQGVRVLIIHSRVPGVFSAGADLKERRAMSAEQAGNFVDALRDTFTLIERFPLPTLAVLEGLALGGGLELALACDIRICGTSTQMALPETALAIIPGAGGTQRLPRLVGTAKAKELIFTGRRVGAEEGKGIGLVNEVTPDGVAMSRAMEMARLILSKGPLAIMEAKRAIQASSEGMSSEGLAVERECYSRILLTEDRVEGLKAFGEKRKPAYKGM